MIVPHKWSHNINIIAMICKENDVVSIFNLVFINAVPPIALKDFGAKFVFLFAFFGIVLRPINFNNQFCFVTIKVCNKIVDCFLALKSHFVFRLLISEREAEDEDCGGEQDV